jgi:drug/metabolite transporter (DMT)-like permease
MPSPAATALRMLPPVLVLKGIPAATFTVSATLAILYLTVVVSIGASVLWLLLIRWSGAASAASYHLLNPFWVVILSNIALSSPLEPRAFIGAAIIGAGLLLTTRSAAPAAPLVLAKTGDRC